jgi:hypothetical protein
VSDNNSSGANGIGIGTVLFVVFLVLKLTHVIDWSWWWVTAPLWIPAALGLLALPLIAWAKS